MQEFQKLLSEHRDILTEIRVFSLQLIRSISNEFSSGEDAYHDAPICSKEKSVELFLKISVLIIKLIPLEHQVEGSTLIKKQNISSLYDAENGQIEDEDIELMRKFLKAYHQNNADTL